MYLTAAKTLCVKAMKTTLDSDYAEADFRNVQVSMEYPAKQQTLPAVWVDFDPIGPLNPVGIGYKEYSDVAGDGGGGAAATRWSFAGNIIYTVVAMTSWERDRLYDELVAIIAFGQYDSSRAPFRHIMETDPLLPIHVNFDRIEQRGFAASPGTPWGTADMMYEATLSVQSTGEFVSTPSTTVLYPISRIDVFTWVSGVQQDPLPGSGWIE
jgi:hypothetical protein